MSSATTDADTALDTLYRLDDDCVGCQGAPSMDIEGWLRSLGLERYEAFRENEIDEMVLPGLTAVDDVCVG
jgi:hypothetical protein